MESNELPKEDKQLISKIDELLGQLKTISQSVFELREHASLVLPDIAPIEQVEQPKEEVNERCGINVGATRSGFDVRVYGIETESQANELKDQIKALLQTL